MNRTPPAVTTSSGALRGAWDGELAVFRGIPYAEPPVGALHLQAPVPVGRWDGVRDATAFGPATPQSSPWGATVADDPNWLTLTVWTPEPGTGAGAGGLPVLVWIHGGGFVIGHSGDPLFDAAEVARGGLVVVSLNYRLGAEGFVGADGAPGNRGLLDQLAALRWVQENVAAFGGDPGRVTVGGESAGASSAAALTAARAAKGLFIRAIAASPAAGFQTPELAAQLGRAFRDLVPNGRLADAGPAELAEAYSLFSAELPRLPEGQGLAGWLAPLGPVVDGDLVEDVPWRVLADGRARDIGLLVTHTRDEGRLFIAIKQQLGTELGGISDVAPPVIADGYHRAWPDADPGRLFETVYSDVLVRMPAVHLAEAHAGAGGRTFMGEVTVAPSDLGACHGIDVPLLFGTYDTAPARMMLGDPVTDEIRAAGDALRRAWTDFVLCGDPGWPAFTGAGGPTRIFGTGGPEVVPYPEQRSRALWAVDDLGPFRPGP
jgi:para-nitrobenzyl esterase